MSASPPPPFAPYGAPPPLPKRSSGRKWKIVLIVCGALLLTCVGGGVGLMWIGKNVIEVEVTNLVRDHPSVREHVGEIRDLDIDLTASGAEDDDDTFVYRVAGSKGNATLTAKHVTNADGSEELISASLRLPDGKTVDITPVEITP